MKSDSKQTTLMRRPADGSRDAEAVGTLPTRAYLDTIDRLQKTAFFNAYNLTTSAQQDILTLPIGGGTHSLLVGGNGSQFASALSPDGRWLAYESDDGMRPQVYVRDPPDPAGVGRSRRPAGKSRTGRRTATRFSTASMRASWRRRS